MLVVVPKEETKGIRFRDLSFPFLVSIERETGVAGIKVGKRTCKVAKTSCSVCAHTRTRVYPFTIVSGPDCIRLCDKCL